MAIIELVESTEITKNNDIKTEDLAK